jgi:toxin FitB
VTFAEIRFGIELVTDPARRTALDIWLARRIRPMFERRVLSVSEDVSINWRLMVEQDRRSGHTFSQPDLIIAAIASHHDLTAVTRNVHDFVKANVPVFNPRIEF